MARGRFLVGSQVSNWIGTTPLTRGGAVSLSRRVDIFTASGTWTCPTGVTYAIAHIRAGGGGGGGTTNSSAGGNSSALGTTATGGRAQSRAYDLGFAGVNSPANSGRGGSPGAGSPAFSNNGARQGLPGGDGTYLVVGSVVTPGTNYTITVGAGGSGGTDGGAGGSGAVWIEYEV